jgi:hypothetical protein
MVFQVVMLTLEGRAASVNDVVNTPETDPVALTLYVATNQFGSWN